MCWLCGSSSKPKGGATSPQQRPQQRPSPPPSWVLFKIPASPTAKLAPARQVTNPKSPSSATEEPSPSVQPNKPKTTKESDGYPTAKLATAARQVTSPKSSPSASEEPSPSFQPNKPKTTKESDGSPTAARQVTNSKTPSSASEEPSPSFQPNKPKTTEESDASPAAKLASARRVTNPKSTPLSSQELSPSFQPNKPKTKDSDGGSLSNSPPLPSHLQLQWQHHDHHPMLITPQQEQRDQAAIPYSTHPVPSISQQPKQDDHLPNPGKPRLSESSHDHFPPKSHNYSPTQHSKAMHDQQPPPSPPPPPNKLLLLMPGDVLSQPFEDVRGSAYKIERV